MCGYVAVFIIANQMLLEPINKRICRGGCQPAFQEASRAVRTGWKVGEGDGEGEGKATNDLTLNT